MVYVLVIIQCLLLVTGQTLFKLELDKWDSLSTANFFSIMFSWRIMLGLAIYVFTTLLWFYIISIAKDKFSIVYPMGSLAYVLGVIIAAVIFREIIPPTRWIGMGVVILGIVLIAR